MDIILVAHNEAQRIEARVKNLLASTYPPEKLRLIVVTDGCTDATAHLARVAGGHRVKVLEQFPRQGKAAGLNAGVAAATAEVIVFADARQQFAPDAIACLVRHLMQPGVGAVSGNYSLHPPADNVGSGVDVYWRLEKFLRQAESRWDSTIGCTGAIYAIRRELFVPLPSDTILDDVVIPMQIVQRGWRVAFAPDAHAWESTPLLVGREFQRKRRTLAGNFQMLFRYPQWLLPWRNRLWWALLCHKYLRLWAPLGLLVLLMVNLRLAGASPLYSVGLYLQAAFYLGAFLGLLWPQRKNRLLMLPAGFVFLNAATVAGFWYYLRHGGQRGWSTLSPPETHAQSAG
ncbi:MAG: glycosyltransferase family 2 protein [Verrucomicrobiae bacterium]|nr:glycosyltransferase family 2 protein [Verrucomicrobiae bacterium]